MRTNRRHFAFVSLLVVAGCGRNPASDASDDAGLAAQAAPAAKGGGAALAVGTELRHEAALPRDADATRRLASLRSAFLVRPDARVLPSHDLSAVRAQSLVGAGEATSFHEEIDAIAPDFPDRQVHLSPATRATTRLPKTADGAVELTSQGAASMRLRVRLAGATTSSGRVAGDAIVYPGALPGSDLFHVPTNVGTEEYVRFDRRPAAAELRYRVELERVAGLRLVPGELAFLTADGNPVLRTTRPWIVDATGRVREGTIGVEGCAYDASTTAPWGRAVTPPGAKACTVVMAWSDADLTYPLLVDPPWTTTASLAQKRANFGAASITGSAAAACASGCAIAAGGLANGVYLSSAELYNAGTGTWATVDPIPINATAGTNGGVPTARALFPMADTTTGFALAVGGWTTGPVADTETFNPAAIATKQWMSRGNLPATAGGGLGPRYSISLATSGNGVGSFCAWATGGWDNANNPSSSFNGIQFGSSLWQAWGGATNAQASTFGYRVGHAIHSWGGYHVVVAGGVYGSTGSTYTSDVTVVDGFNACPGSNPIQFSSSGSLSAPSSNLASAAAAGKVYLAGGISPFGFALSSVDSFDMSTGAVAKVGALSIARENLTGATSSNAFAVFVGGDNAAGGACPNSAGMFGGSAQADVVAATVAGQPIASDQINYPRTNHRSVTLPSGAVLVIGGFLESAACTFTYPPYEEIFNPQNAGVTCTSNADCKTSNCVDGVCCDTPCAGQCQACNLPGHVGTCTTVTASNGPTSCVGAQTGCLSGQAVSGFGSTTRAACASYGAACGSSCSGASATSCTYPTSTCSAASCVANATTPVTYTQSSTAYCDGLGHCQTPVSTPCGLLGCNPGNTACKAFCAADSDCVSGYYCQGSSCALDQALATGCTRDTQCASGHCTNGVCCGVAACAAPQTCNANGLGSCSLPTAQTCTSNAQCGSGFCVDGYCCNSACNAQCQACDITPGTCTNVTSGQPHGGRAKCTGYPSTSCAAQCNGSTTCGAPPGATTVCQVSTCAGATSVTPTEYCDGAGSCVAQAAAPCGGYLCSASAGSAGSCYTSCTSSAQCAAGYYCNASGQCVTTGALGTTCTGNAQCASGNCVNGACCSSASCGAGQSCAVNGLGTCSSVIGQACTLSSQCGSGNCVDGYCCNSACSGQCEACNVAGSLGVCSAVAGAPHGSRSKCTGSGSCAAQCDGSNRATCGALPGISTVCVAATCASGVQSSTQYCDGTGNCAPPSTSNCGAYVCGGPSCKTGCGTNNDCATGYYCDGANCVTTGSLGSLCTSASQCPSGFCTDGVCCTVGSCASGTTCNATKNGTCAKPNGSACKANTECGSGNCVDGYCCNSVCAGECEACDVGGSVGQCTTVAGPPHGARKACPGTGACQAQCDGSNRIACGTPPGTSTSCVAAACASGVSTSIAYCDGAGNCGSPTTKPCVPYACDATTACKGFCTTTADCASGYACKSSVCVTQGGLGTICTADDQCTSGHCVASGAPGASVCCGVASCVAGSACGDTAAGPAAGSCVKQDGQTCAANGDCASGYCVDGVCCDGACTGQCEACDVKGVEGKCSGVSGAPHGKRAACADGGGDVCKVLACDGTKDRTKCAAFASGLDKECVAPSCTNGTATSSATCDGAGKCTQPTTSSCGAYACGATACKTSCTADADCANSYTCTGGKCVPQVTATCSPDGTQSIPVSGDAGVPQSCQPYRCTSTGACGTTCATSDDCLAGNTCDTSSSKCLPSAVTPTDTGSGGCAVVDATSSSASPAWLGVAGIAGVVGALARRRRRAGATRSR
jgi:hypothetical protein